MWEVINKLVESLLNESKKKDGKIDMLEEAFKSLNRIKTEYQDKIEEQKSEITERLSESLDTSRKINQLKEEINDLKKNYCQTILLDGKPCNNSLDIQQYVTTLEHELEQIHDSRVAYVFYINGSETTDCHEVQQYINKLEELIRSDCSKMHDWQDYGW